MTPTEAEMFAAFLITNKETAPGRSKLTKLELDVVRAQGDALRAQLAKMG